VYHALEEAIIAKIMTSLSIWIISLFLNIRRRIEVNCAQLHQVGKDWHKKVGVVE
jgi:hypothetical protein